MPITHSKVSAIDDGADTTVIRPSDWNANHALPTSGELVTAGYGVSLTNATAGTCAVSLTTASNPLGADVTATISAYVGVCTVSLTPGTWWLSGHTQCTLATATTVVVASTIRDGSTVYAAASDFRSAVANNNIHLAADAIVTPAVTTSYWLSVTASRAAVMIRYQAQGVSATPSPATYLAGFRIA
jgi:hypothetical protein